MDFRPIVKEQRHELERLQATGQIIPREGLQIVQGWLNHPNIVAVLGVRRGGKSVFSYLLGKDLNFGYMNFDDERIMHIGPKDLNSILETFYELYGDPELIILDEIQRIEGWELFANRLRRTKRVIVTGSNSELLSGELSSKLTGRYTDLVLYPFSFREYLRSEGNAPQSVYTTQEKAAVLRALDEYLHSGGFPEVRTIGKTMLPAIYDGIVMKDIILKRGIRKKDDFRRLAKYLISNHAQEVTYTKLAHMLAIRQVSTISNWVSYLEDAFLLIKVERFSYKLKEQFRAPKKVYCVDNGLIGTIGFSPTESLGRLMENVVAVELHRRKAFDRDLDVYYWKDHRQNEVDFILKRGARITTLIQVTYAYDRADIQERELKALLNAAVDLRCNELLILTWDYDGVEQYQNATITFTPLWQWLSDHRSPSFPPGSVSR